jgi:hypothetical protein
MNIGSTPPEPTRQRDEPISRAANLGYAAVAGQAGCFTLAITLIALIVGIWLDAQTGTRGPFTIGLLILSVPFSLFVMLKVAMGAIHRINPPRQKLQPDAEEVDR